MCTHPTAVPLLCHCHSMALLSNAMDVQQQDWQYVAQSMNGGGGLTVWCVLQRNLMVAKHLVKARASDKPTTIPMFGPDR